MLTLRKIALLLTLLALSAPVAACGEEDVRDQAEQARDDAREQAEEIGRDIDRLSERDVREALDSMSTKELRAALNDVERKAEEGGATTKREARELERKIERELESRR